MTGSVYLVGAGPGDPDLLTLGALKAIRIADVVLYDRLVSPDIVDLIPERTQRIPVGKSPNDDQDTTQRRILWLMVAHALQGRTVVRLKGGDPFVFGRGGEEWEHLTRNGIPVHPIPGITSALAVPARAGIPLTHRGVSGSFAVITGHRADGPTHDWARHATIDTLVVLMGVAHRAHIANKLIAAGRPANQPAAFLERGTTPDERIVTTTLGAIAAGQVSVESPAVLVIGDVVAVRERLEPHAEPEPDAHRPTVCTAESLRPPAPLEAKRRWRSVLPLIGVSKASADGTVV